MRLVSLLDLFLTLDTLRFSDQAHEEINNYYDAMLAPVELTREQPDLFTGVIPDRTATVRLANATGKGTGGYGFGSTGGGAESGFGTTPPGGSAQHPVLAHFQAAEDIRGKTARVRVRDLDTSTDLLDLTGTVQDLTMTVEEARLTISATDTEAMQELLPRVRLLDIYPTANIQNVNDTDAPVVVVFGEMREVALVLCQSATNQYDYGAFRKPATGSLVVNAVYRNGRVVQSGEYSLVESPANYYVIRFTRQQMDPNGSPFRIQATVTATEFTNPANVIKFLLNDATFGLGRTVNAASFSTAVTAYSTLSMAVVGGLTRREPAGDLLSLLLLYGAMLDKNTAGEYTILVDSAAAHTSSSIVLGADDGQWNNVLLPSINVPLTPLVNHVKQINISGLFKPGFQGSGVYLLKATRSASTRKGTVKEIQNPFLGDVTSIDKQVDYLWKRLCCKDKQVECSTEMSVSQSLTLGQLVRFNSPDLAIDEVYEVRQLGFRGSKDRDGNIEAAVTVGLNGYLASIFTYTAGTVQAAPTASYITDYSLTLPGAPTGFALNGSATILTANDGKKKTLQPVKATAPAVNVTQLWFRAVPAGAVQAPYTTINVTLGQIDVASTLEMQPGIVYTLECYAYNGANDPSARLSLVAQITSHTAAGDTTAPSAGSAIVVRQAGGKVVEIDCTFTEPPDWGTTELYRNTTNNSATATLIDSGKKKRFHDQNVSYGSIYYYWFKIGDNTYVSTGSSSNLSGFSPSSGHSITVAKILTGDVGAGEIKTGNVGTGEIDTGNIAGDAVTPVKRSTLSSASFSHSHTAPTHSHTVIGGSTSSDTVNHNSSVSTITHSLGRYVLAVIDTGNSVIAGHYRSVATNAFDVCTVSYSASATVSGVVYYW